MTFPRSSLALESLESRSISDQSDLLTDYGNLFALESDPQIISTKKLTSSFVFTFLPTLGFAQPSDA